MDIPAIELDALIEGDHAARQALRNGLFDVGFLRLDVRGTNLADTESVLAAYRRFFTAPLEVKAAIDMARTGAPRGWGRPGAEQVNPDANPDYKEVFDCGFEPDMDEVLDPADATIRAPNQWPELAGFRRVIEDWRDRSLTAARALLRGIEREVAVQGLADAFDRPMALLRGNYYPPRPPSATAQDFGIAAHTDYGCVTWLIGDGTPGLEIEHGGTWLPVQTDPDHVVINFGEMLEMWSGGRIKATGHRVIGSSAERLSVAHFINPSPDTNVAPPDATTPLRAGDHLRRRFAETYLHLDEAGE